MENAKSGN